MLSPRRAIWLIVVAATLAAAQTGPFPGQPGPGQNPNRGPGVPWPSRNPPSQPESDGQKPPQPLIPAKFTGKVAAVDDKSLAIEAPDHRVLTYQIDKTTQATSDGETIGIDTLQPGDEVEVESKPGKDDAVVAVQVRLLKVAHPATVVTGIAGGSQAGQPAPKLKRGKPSPKELESDPVPENAPQAQVASVLPQPALGAAATAPSAPPNPNLALIEKAAQMAEATTESLPNFLCDQFTTRYISERKPAEWEAQDVVSAKVVYEDGRERYENIMSNGKPLKDPLHSGDRSWSTGEFGTFLRDLFSPSTAAAFHYSESAEQAGESASIYDFQVEQSRSHWKVSTESQYMFPAYRGSVWVAKATGRTLRIESQAIELPKEFPLDTTESAIDYDYVRIGEGRYLLPVRAEILTCTRGTSMCARNVIEFRNYRRFGSESTVKFGQQ